MANNTKILPIIESLMNVYGKPSSAVFGSSVFYNTLNYTPLESEALNNYKAFLGGQWNADTETRWKSTWKKCFERPKGTTPDILTELNGIKDADAKRSVPLLTELIDNADQGKLALAAVFNHADMTKVEVYTVGDGEALSGLLLCGLFTENTVCSVICLMD